VKWNRGLNNRVFRLKRIRASAQSLTISRCVRGARRTPDIAPLNTTDHEKYAIACAEDLSWTEF